jgi:hypothetical protein
MDQAARVLAILAEGLNDEEEEAYEALEDKDDNETDDRPLDRWVNFHEGLTDEEKCEIELNIWPVQTMLTKVMCYVSSGV